MKILVVYATYSSGTQVASYAVVDTLKKTGHDVTLKNVKDVGLEEFNNFDLVIMGSPSWKIKGKEGQPHQYYFDLAQKTKGKKYPKQFAIFGLGHSPHYALFTGAVDQLEQMVKDWGGILLTPSLRIDQYYFDQKNNDERIKTWVQELLKKLG